MRLDAFLAQQFSSYSRVQLRKAIDSKLVAVNGKNSPLKIAFRLQEGDVVQLTVPAAPTAGPIPEDIPLDILYEDDWLAVVNKPPGMVVHPARGHWSGTLTSALAFHFDKLSGAGGATRPGIVHRLDRDTSGLILVAKPIKPHFVLASAIRTARRCERIFCDCRWCAGLGSRSDRYADWYSSLST